MACSLLSRGCVVQVLCKYCNITLCCLQVAAVDEVYTWVKCVSMHSVLLCTWIYLYLPPAMKDWFPKWKKGKNKTPWEATEPGIDLWVSTEVWKIDLWVNWEGWPIILAPLTLCRRKYRIDRYLELRFTDDNIAVIDLNWIGNPILEHNIITRMVY